MKKCDNKEATSEGSPPPLPTPPEIITLGMIQLSTLVSRMELYAGVEASLLVDA